MPAGRYAKLFGYAYVVPLSDAVSVTSLCKYRKRSAEALTPEQIKDFEDRLRFAFWIYQTDHRTPHSTRTTQSQFLEKVKISAQRFLKDPSRLWANRLLGGINEGSDDDRAALYSRLDGCSGRAILKMQRNLEHLHGLPQAAPNGEVEELPSAFLAICNGQESQISPGSVNQDTIDRIRVFVTEYLSVVQAMGAIDPNAPRASGRWPNPALAKLALGLEPIWVRVTGRTSGLTSDDRTTNHKRSLFAKWLVGILEQANLPRASQEQVIGIVRADRRERKKEKSTTP